ncbi:MAG: hypothetical protein IT462_14300 [Planctomycetes bacterium]|nr:hypothetical protein [Planctomycetota bacterium]
MEMPSNSGKVPGRPKGPPAAQENRGAARRDDVIAMVARLHSICGEVPVSAARIMAGRQDRSGNRLALIAAVEDAKHARRQLHALDKGDVAAVVAAARANAVALQPGILQTAYYALRITDAKLNKLELMIDAVAEIDPRRALSFAKCNLAAPILDRPGRFTTAHHCILPFCVLCVGRRSRQGLPGLTTVLTDAVRRGLRITLFTLTQRKLPHERGFVGFERLSAELHRHLAPLKGESTGVSVDLLGHIIDDAIDGRGWHHWHGHGFVVHKPRQDGGLVRKALAAWRENVGRAWSVPMFREIDMYASQEQIEASIRKCLPYFRSGAITLRATTPESCRALADAIQKKPLVLRPAVWAKPEIREIVHPTCAFAGAARAEEENIL